MNEEQVMDDEELVFNPEQDADEKRELRRGYRELQRTTDGKEVSINDVTAQQLANGVKQADNLFQKVMAPQEAILDSEYLLKISNMGAQKARAMRYGGGGFDVDDFVTKLITFMGGQSLPENLDEAGSELELDDGDEPLDWDKIGRKALAKSRRVPTMGFMLGPLSIQQKERVVGKRAKLEINKEDMKKPQELHEEDIQRSENETTKNVAQLNKILEQETGVTEGDENQDPTPINLFKFIINPKDFAQSVENMFYLSFLIRDGLCALEYDKNTDEPMIWSCAEPSPEDRANGVRRQQIVLELDMATWQKAIEVFNITEPMIPQRPPAKTRLGDKWYG